MKNRLAVLMSQRLHVQFLCYVFVGLVLNAGLYGVYLLLTWRSMGHEAAMTITFALGTLLSFLANRSITFRHRGDRFAALRRFVACYAVLYLTNVLALWVFASQMHVPHQIVQGCVILVLALLSFMAQKYWVFPSAPNTQAPGAARLTR